MKIENILVSQPAPAILEKSPFYEISQKHKVNIDYHPFIKVEGVSLKEFRSQRVEILAHTAIIFTSRTTVDSFFRICEEARITVPETMKYLCNTEAVALYLQKYIIYRKRKIFFANGSFVNFMELILKHKEEKFLLTLSEPHKPELPATLEKLKLKFDKVILSRAVNTDVSAIDPSKYDLMVFYSPSEIAAVMSAYTPEQLPMIGVFGDGAVRAALAAGLTVSIMAPMPGVPSMAKAVDILATKVAAGEPIEPVAAPGVDKKTEEFVKAQQSKIAKKSKVRKAATSTSKTAAKKQ